MCWNESSGLGLDEPLHVAEAAVEHRRVDLILDRRDVQVDGHPASTLALGLDGAWTTIIHDWRAAVGAFRADLSVQAEVRKGLEDRYLDGHVAVFPETLGRWQRLREAVEDLPNLGPPEPAALDPEPETAWVEAQTEHILRWARVRALDLIGDGEAAMAVAEPVFRLPRATADAWPAREGPPSPGIPRSDGSRS